MAKTYNDPPAATGGKFPRRVEPTFEGDRKLTRMSEITRRVDEEIEEEVRFDPVETTGQASDYAQPDVRKLANLEEEISKLAQQEAIPVLERQRDIGNSVGLKKAQHIISNTVTAAHDAACDAVDVQVEECRALLVRIEKGAEAHKARVREGGQTIAVDFEAAIQVLKRQAEWYEQEAPNIRKPKLDPPVESVPPIVEENGAQPKATGHAIGPEG